MGETMTATKRAHLIAMLNGLPGGDSHDLFIYAADGQLCGFSAGELRELLEADEELEKAVKLLGRGAKAIRSRPSYATLCVAEELEQFVAFRNARIGAGTAAREGGGE